VIYL